MKRSKRRDIGNLQSQNTKTKQKCVHIKNCSLFHSITYMSNYLDKMLVRMVLISLQSFGWVIPLQQTFFLPSNPWPLDGEKEKTIITLCNIFSGKNFLLQLGSIFQPHSFPDDLKKHMNQFNNVLIKPDDNTGVQLNVFSCFYIQTYYIHLILALVVSFSF